MLNLFQWRGAAAGLIGGVLGIFLAQLAYHKSAYAALYWGFFAAPYFLPPAVLAGLLLGAFARFLVSRFRSTGLAGALIGALAAGVVGGSCGLLFDLVIIREAAESPNTKFFLLFGAVVGISAGLICGSQGAVQKNGRSS